MNAIEGRGLRKSYVTGATATRALDGIDIDVADGEFLAVMGPSGSGKSTLLHVLGALDEADEGDVAIGGTRLSGSSRAELAVVRRRAVGFVFQFFNLVPVLTVEENVMLPSTLDDDVAEGAEQRAGELFEMLEIADLRTKLPSQLSGGQQQRVAIARAMINDPSVLLADEPTGNLDRASGEQVMALLHGLNERGKTIVIVTHDVDVASNASRVVFMRDGRLRDETRADADDASTFRARIVQLEA